MLAFSNAFWNGVLRDFIEHHPEELRIAVLARLLLAQLFLQMEADQPPLSRAQGQPPGRQSPTSSRQPSTRQLASFFPRSPHRPTRNSLSTSTELGSSWEGPSRGPGTPSSRKFFPRYFPIVFAFAGDLRLHDDDSFCHFLCFSNTYICDCMKSEHPNLSTSGSSGVSGPSPYPGLKPSLIDPDFSGTAYPEVGGLAPVISSCRTRLPGFLRSRSFQ